MMGSSKRENKKLQEKTMSRVVYNTMKVFLALKPKVSHPQCNIAVKDNTVLGDGNTVYKSWKVIFYYILY